MDNNIPAIDELIKLFAKLPGLGPKSAKRIILKLINNKESMVKPLAQSLAKVYKSIVRCLNCGNLKIIEQVCVCEGMNTYDKICVVENLADMWAIESSNIYKGEFLFEKLRLNSNENYDGNEDLTDDYNLNQKKYHKRSYNCHKRNNRRTNHRALY